MKNQIRDEIQAEIRRRAFERADILQATLGCKQNTRFTLDALQTATGLTRNELETIAAEVHRSFAAEEDNFFSMRQQLVVVSATVGLSAAFIWLIAGLI
jgi:hypothetical protein